MPKPTADTAITPPTQAALSATTVVASILLTALPAIAVGSRLIQDPAGRGLLNPDSAMRLVRLEDILAAHAPLHAVMRDASGHGNILPWSHALDSLLLLLAAPLTPWLPWPEALHLIALAFGPLCLAALGVAIAWAAAPAVPRPGQAWLWFGAFAAGASVAVYSYGMAGVVHHHVPLALAVVLAAGWALRILRGGPPVSGGIALGAATAAGLWLSPEALPFSLLALGAIGTAWLTVPPASRPALATAMLATTTALATLAILAWLVDPPASGLAAIELDRLSLPYILIALGAALVALVARLTGHRLATLSTAALLGVAWLATFPQLLHGTEALMTPDQAAAFMAGINEMRPVHGLDQALACLTGGTFALLALLAFAWRHRRTPHAAVMLYAALCILASLVLAASHVRFAAYPTVAGAAMLPVVLAAISASSAPAHWQALGRIGIAVGLLAAPLLAPMAAAASSQPPDRSPDHASMPCPLAGAAALLAPHPGQIVLAGVSETPHLLYRTRIRTVGSLYHRNPEAYMRLRAAWRTIPVDGPAPPEFLATGATLVLGCPNEPRDSIVQDLPRTTLLDRLAASDPPSWLEPIANAGPGGFVLYAVRP